MNIIPFFINLLLEDRLTIDNHALTNYCLAMHELDAGRKISNKTGWQSNDIDLNALALQPLINQMQLRIRNICDAYAIRNTLDFKIENGWININKRNSWNTPHCHLGTFSAVYYVQAYPAQGALQLVDRDNSKTSMFNPLTVDSINGANNSSYTILPATGKLVIFPSWVLHYVDANETDDERISIAFNITLPKF